MERESIQVGSLVHVEGLNFMASVVALYKGRAMCLYYSEKLEDFDIIDVNPDALKVRKSPVNMDVYPGVKARVAGNVNVLVDGHPKPCESPILKHMDVYEVRCMYDANGRWKYTDIVVSALMPPKVMGSV